MSAPNPFKGLHPYTTADRDKLFGRDRDVILMKDRIYSARTTLLFAGSGVGKTSFLNAKIIPELQTYYDVFYHNAWAGPAEPLDAVKTATLARRIDGAHDGARLLDILRPFRRNPEPGATGRDVGRDSALRDRCLLIFDQFEEVFQYHAYEDYFKRFVRELCEVIGAGDYNVHVVFSMREEFLGELSVFENAIPDLFNNYYRLKYPGRFDARQIIEGTCRLAETDVNRRKLDLLLSDLSKVEKGAAGAAERSTTGGKAAGRVIERDFIIPPYLQIACHKIWEERAGKAPAGGNGNAAPFVFLDDYEEGQAQRTLQKFCFDKLSALSFREKDLAAQSFDFLVTKQGAKMAYEFASLASAMRLRFSKKKLKTALDKLSAPDTRILRYSRGPDQSHWYELYHDIYGKILDTWKHSFRQTKFNLYFWGLVATFVLLLALIPLTWIYVYKPRVYTGVLNSAKLQEQAEYGRALEAYNLLKGTYGYEPRAATLWAAAWERRARFAESQDKRDEALLCWLKAISVEPEGSDTERRRRKADALIGDDYPLLRATLRHENSLYKSFFSADGGSIVTQTYDNRVRVWDVSTGELAEKPLIFEPPRQPRAEQEAERRGHTAGPQPRTDRPRGRGRDTLAVTQAADDENERRFVIQAAARHPEHGLLIAAITYADLNYSLRGKNKRRGETQHMTARVSIRLRGEELAGESPVQAESRVTDDWYRNHGPNVVMSPDGKHLATSGWSTSTRVWTLDGGRYIPHAGFKRNIGFITKSVFSPDSRYLLTDVGGNKSYVWDVTTGNLVNDRPIPAGGREARFTPDASILLTLDPILKDDPSSYYEARHELKAWKTLTGEAIASHQTPVLYGGPRSGEIRRLGVTPDGKGAVLLLEDYVEVFDIQTMRYQGGTKNDFKGGLRGMVSHPDGLVLLSSFGEDACLYSVPLESQRGKILKMDNPINSGAISEDGKKIVTLSAQPTPTPSKLDEEGEEGEKYIAQVWDADSGAAAGEPVGNVLAVSSDGKYLAVEGLERRQVQVLDVQAGGGGVVSSFNYPEGPMPTAISFTQGGK